MGFSSRSCGRWAVSCSHAPTWRGCPEARRWPSIASCSPGKSIGASRGHPDISVVREEVADLPSPGIVATGPLTSDRLAAAITARLGSSALAFYDAIAPVVANDSLDHSRLYALSRYGKGDGRRLPQRAARRRGIRGIPRCARRGGSASRARVRPGAVLRGVPSRRGDGAAGPRDAPLRPDEAGGTSRSTKRQGAPCGRSVAAGGPGGTDVEPRRLPDSAAHSGAAAGIPDDSRDSSAPSFCDTGAFTGMPTSTAPRRSATRSPLADDDRLFFAGQLTGVEGYTESLGTGLMAGINLARRLEGRDSLVPAANDDAGRRSTAICATPIRRTSSR